MEAIQETSPQAPLLRFQLSGGSYAFDVLKTREVLSVVKITPLPSALDFLAGIINLRGSVVPVVSLRKKFGFPPAEDTLDTTIIIVEIDAAGENTVIGAVVDAVKGVMLCDEKDLSPPPRFGMQLNANLVKAIAKKDETFIVILDTEKVFSEHELWLIKDHPIEEEGTPG